MSKNPVFDYDTLHAARLSLAGKIAAHWAERLNGALVAGEGTCDLQHDASYGVVNDMAVAEILRLAQASGVEVTEWSTTFVEPDKTFTRLTFVSEIAPPERKDNVVPLFPRGPVH